MEPLGILQTYWGYDSFKPMQEEIINAALAGRDVLAILPTGGGKSVCFQVPALAKEGLALVVTPLIALMKDQVQNLNDKGIKALALHAGMSRRELRLVLGNAAWGDFKFLYVSPERLDTELFQSFLPQLRVNYIVVDEAHCISQWGYDFRPDYLRIGEMREKLDAPVIALTATATPRVAEDIMDKLNFREKLLLRGRFERPNLSYIVRETSDKAGQLLRICAGVPGSGIIYVRNRKKTEELASFLAANGVSASCYHAGLGHRSREQRQADWKRGEIRIMVCTNAFGMGIDKPDVRMVLHYDLPESPEAYFQEAGRAGRDGKRAYAVQLWNAGDVSRLKQLERQSFPPLDFVADVYQKIHIHAGVPYGGGMGKELKFDLEEFCRHFGLNRAQTHHALQYLDRVGHWSYCEAIDTDTKVKILLERDELNKVELPSEAMYRLLELLMRKCEAVFSYPVPVNEEYFAGLMGVEVPTLRQLLYGLGLSHVIAYIPSRHSDVLYLHHPRLEPGNLDMMPERYKMLLDCSMERVLAMEAYVTGGDVCRARFLMSYFGQEDSSDCGCCDVCRARRTPAPDTRSKLKSLILSSKGSYTLADLAPTFSHPDADPFWSEILRVMIDRGEVPPYRM